MTGFTKSKISNGFASPKILIGLALAMILGGYFVLFYQMCSEIAPPPMGENSPYVIEREGKQYFCMTLFQKLKNGGLFSFGNTTDVTPIDNQETQPPSPPDTTSWQTYRNEEYGFELKIPPSWTHYIVEKEIKPAGSEYVFNGEGSQFQWAVYEIGIKGKDLGAPYFAEQMYGLFTVLVFDISDARKLNIEAEVKEVFGEYKLVPAGKRYFVLYESVCQDCYDGDPLTALRKSTGIVLGTFQITAVHAE